MKHLIIGNGAAGITAAGRIKEINPSDCITIATAEGCSAYSKIMLPDFIGGKMEREKLFIRDLSYYEKNGINLLMNSKATKVNTKKKLVEFLDGKTEHFDKILIAVGGKSFIPAIEGLDEAGYYTINSLGDADLIKRKSNKGEIAVILGGGLTGVEMAFALGRLGVKVYLIEMGEILLPQHLDIDSSDILVNELSKFEVNVLTGVTVTGIHCMGKNNRNNKEGNNPANNNNGENEFEKSIKANQTVSKQVELSDGSRLDFDLFIMATGTRSDIEFIKDTEIEYNRGILVDEYLKTSEDDFYAAGDVSQMVNVPNEYVQSYIWPNAMAQGKCAGSNMAGQITKFRMETYLQNVVQLRDIPFNSMGNVRPRNEKCEVLIHKNKENGIYKRIVINNNIIIGALFIGDISSARKISALIKNREDISTIKNELIDR